MTPPAPNEELKELKHETQPGYPSLYARVFLGASIWLVALFAWGTFVGKTQGH